MPTPSFTTLIELLRMRAERQPDQRAYTFLADGETETERLTYQELDQRARIIGAWLQDAKAQGERVLLLYPPGLEFIAAFFGCLYAGAVAVPAYPPRRKASWPRLASIVADAEARFALSTAEVITQVEAHQAQWPDLLSLRWVATSGLPLTLADDWREPPVQSETLALLQYTSGSTGAPKGVMISQRNLLHNLEIIQQGLGFTSAGHSVLWLPIYHDMGLIGGVLGTLYIGMPLTLMPPTAFVERPWRWLAAFLRYGGTASSAPNFAYDLCVERIRPDQLAALDLSRWEAALCGAEPVRLATLERFAATFAPCGFRREAFSPCYGLAEATLMVSRGGKFQPLKTQTVSRAALREKRVVAVPANDDQAQILVGCGQSAPEQKILIVAPDDSRICPPNTIGEIWISGPSVAQGYWGKAEETAAVFGAHLADTGEGPFLRTGDLGFLHEGELFITGRLKDLIIIRGLNYHPQDIEQVAETSHPALAVGGSAAFSIEGDRSEQLVIVCEVKRQERDADVEEVASAVRAAVAQVHELETYAVALIRPGHLPRTTSGKAQRYLCRTQFLEHQLTLLGLSVQPRNHRQGEALSPVDPEIHQRLDHLIRTQLAELLQVNPEQIDVSQPIQGLGLGSLQATKLRFNIEEQFNISLPPEIFFEDLSLAEFIDRISALTMRLEL